MNRLIAALLLLVSSASSVTGQTQRLPIFVDYSGDDPVGTNVVFQFKEAVRRSASYELVNHQEGAGIVVSIVTLGVDGSARTALSIVGTVAYLGCERGREQERSALFLHNLYITARERSVESGNNLLADLDKAWADANRKWKQDWKQEGCQSQSGPN
jgi:hypothetical protein